MKEFVILLEMSASTNEVQSIWQAIHPLFEEQTASLKVIEVSLDNPRDFKNLASFKEVSPVITIGSSQLLIEAISYLNSQSKLCPVCFIPTKSTTNLAKSIGLALQPQTAAKQILTAIQPVYVELAKIEEMNHQRRWLFNRSMSLGFNAYAENVSQNSQLNKFSVSRIAQWYGHLTAIVDQEPFNVTLRLDRKYYFFRHAFAVQVDNQAKVSDQPLDLKKLPLRIEILSNLNLFSLLLFKIAKLVGLEHKLPYVHIFKGSSFQLTTDSLEFGEIDGQQLKNQFYDLLARSFQYPFWFDPDNLSLHEQNK
ncbi:hypothetical protein [Liquorilactobacillus sicerae]|uniref:hypothetical protein n=1 Tax=Liquorilactobacillus sicerae TaxID=1416943 RepID=UPI002480E224|nr:hypothetical protein [Liquorilactobacillus sicerae]